MDAPYHGSEEAGVGAGVAAVEVEANDMMVKLREVSMFGDKSHGVGFGEVSKRSGFGGGSEIWRSAGFLEKRGRELADLVVDLK